MKDRFQDKILGQKLMFKPKEHFVQILHNKSFHWVTVSNVNSKSGSVDYYDSLFHGRIKDHVKLQIANLSKTLNTLKTLNWKYTFTLASNKKMTLIAECL